MKKDKNNSHSAGGFTQNSTTIDVSKQNCTSQGNNHGLSVRFEGVSPQEQRDRRIKMPTKLLQVLNKARI